MWRTARHLHQALCRPRAHRPRHPGAGFATADLTGGRWSDHEPGQAPADPVGDEHHPAHPPEDGGLLAPLPPGRAWRRPAHQARVVLSTADWVAVGFSLGVTEVLRRADEDPRSATWDPTCWAPTGTRPRPCGGWAPTRAARSARRCSTSAPRRHRQHVQVRAVLRVGPDPWHRSARSDLTRLVRRAKQMLEQNVTRATQATTGDLREPFWVYRRDKAPCRRCGTTIRWRCAASRGGTRVVLVPRCQA